MKSYFVSEKGVMNLCFKSQEVDFRDGKPKEISHDPEDVKLLEETFGLKRVPAPSVKAEPAPKKVAEPVVEEPVEPPAEPEGEPTDFPDEGEVLSADDIDTLEEDEVKDVLERMGVKYHPRAKEETLKKKLKEALEV